MVSIGASTLGLGTEPGLGLTSEEASGKDDGVGGIEVKTAEAEDASGAVNPRADQLGRASIKELDGWGLDASGKRTLHSGGWRGIGVTHTSSVIGHSHLEEGHKLLEGTGVKLGGLWWRRREGRRRRRRLRRLRGLFCVVHAGSKNAPKPS
jgi:hypothetical protein